MSPSPTIMSASRWIPLESNPEVLNSWASKAGLVTSQDGFGDIYGLDLELLEMVPKPVKAVILLFPDTPESRAKRKAKEENRRAARGGDSIDPTVFWMKQTIGNACGTMAILHALANANVTFEPESPIAQFIEEAQGKTPLERAALLENTPLFANIHAETASSGQSAVPEDLYTDLHFTCFIPAPDADARNTGSVTSNKRVIELDGERDGPVDHGPFQDDDEFLQIVADIIRSEFISQSTSLRFNLMYLGVPS